MELEYEAEMAVAEIRQLLRGKPAGIDAIDDDGATIMLVSLTLKRSKDYG